MVSEDANSAEVLKPFLAGRDVKRYRQPKSTDYLILVPSGWTRKKLGWQRNKRGSYSVPPINPAYPTPWEAFTAHYPAVANYLLPFAEKAESRTDKGNYWWELRACDYYNEFEKPKIIIPTFATSAPYTYDVNGLYSNDKTTIVPTEDLFVLGVLNSLATDFFFKSIGAKLKDNFYEYKPKYLSQLPIPNATPAQQAEIATLVESILTARVSDATADTSDDEAAVDALVVRLFDLTPEEEALVRGKVTVAAAEPAVS